MKEEVCFVCGEKTTYLHLGGELVAHLLQPVMGPGECVAF